MVAITVILAAVIGTFVLDIGQSAGNSAPQASLTVDTSVSNDDITIEHEGGDALDAQQTRIVLTNESTGNSAEFTEAGSSDVLQVGGSATINMGANPEAVPSGTWSSYSNADADIGGVKKGVSYTITLIDVETQRVIYETEVTA